MQENTLDRVREDLATMTAAMGRGLPFGATDVRFHAALAGASGVFAASHALGAQRGGSLLLAGLPAVLIFVAYLGYMAVKQRSLVNVTRRKDYRTTLLVLAPVAAAAAIGRYWAASAGMSHLQFGGALLVVMGCSLIIIAITSPRPAGHPRSYWLGAGAPLIAAGAWLPFCTRAQGVFAIGCMSTAAFGLLAGIMHYHVRRQDQGASHATD